MNQAIILILKNIFIKYLNFSMRQIILVALCNTVACKVKTI